MVLDKKHNALDVKFEVPALKVFVEASLENTLWKDVVDLHWNDELNINVTIFAFPNAVKSAINEIAAVKVGYSFVFICLFRCISTPLCVHH